MKPAILAASLILATIATPALAAPARLEKLDTAAPRTVVIDDALVDDSVDDERRDVIETTLPPPPHGPATPTPFCTPAQPICP